jgi:hypothetical protein
MFACILDEWENWTLILREESRLEGVLRIGC